jgi:transposase-like protein
VKLPQMRGRTEPYRSQLWRTVGTTSVVLKKLIVEMDVGGRSQRDIEAGVEQALGQVVLSKSTVSEITAALSEE